MHSVGDHEGLYWRCAALVTWDWDDWSWSTHTPCLLQIINGRLPTGSTKFSSCLDFTVKLSLSICSHTDSSCPSCWHTYAIPGEDLSTYLLVCDKSCFVQRQIIKSVCSSLRLAPQWYIFTLVNLFLPNLQIFLLASKPGKLSFSILRYVLYISGYISGYQL